VGGGSQLTCPHCGLRAMPAWRKLALGPSAKVACRSCGLAVGVAPLPALVSFVPCAVVVLAVTLRWMTRPVPMVVAGAAAIAVTGWAYLLAVPLVPRGFTDARAVRAARERLR
jgi:hypothetical protein